MDPPDPSPSYTRLFFTFLQCLHHRSIMKRQRDGHHTKAFSSKLHHLNSFIKPAFPGPTILRVLNDANHNWLQSITGILGSHYTRGAEHILSQIQNLYLPASDIRHYSGQAIQWAKNRFGHKISPQTISYFLSAFDDLRQQTNKNPKPQPTTSQPSPKRQTSQTKNPTPQQNTTKKPILDVRGAGNPLSNFYPCSFEFGGIKFKSSEHAYQYQKACYFDCSDHLKQTICKAPNALAAKQAVDGLPKTAEWNLYKPLLMFQLLSSKFKQVPIFRKNLEEAFRSGAEIHHPVNDPFWGNGRDGNGKNWFGWSLQSLAYAKFGSTSIWDTINYTHIKTVTKNTQPPHPTIPTTNRYSALETPSTSDASSVPSSTTPISTLFPSTSPPSTLKSSNHPLPSQTNSPPKSTSKTKQPKPTTSKPQTNPPINQTIPTTNRYSVLDTTSMPGVSSSTSSTPFNRPPTIPPTTPSPTPPSTTTSPPSSPNHSTPSSTQSTSNSPSNSVPSIPHYSPKPNVPTTNNVVTMDDPSMSHYCGDPPITPSNQSPSLPPSQPLYTSVLSPLFLSPSPTFQISPSQNVSQTPSVTEYPPINPSSQISPSQSPHFSGTSYSDVLTNAQTPYAPSTMPIASRPKTLSKYMFSATPCKRPAPSPLSSPDSPSTVPPAPKRVCGKSPKQTSSPCRPNTHPNQPKSSWKLPLIEKTVLVIGDSNLSRITSTTNKNIQVESYPGAKICHGNTLVKNYSYPAQPDKVILSFGINNRSSEPKNTSFQNLRTLIGTTLKKFPKSEIYFPLVNFSNELPSKEVSNLTTLNQLAQEDLRRVTIIPCLDPSQFETSVKDPVHWTKKSANSILKHWLNHLN